MKCKRHAAMLYTLACILSLSLIPIAWAGNTGLEQGEQTVVAIWSRTDMNSVPDSELAAIYREADANLTDQVREGLIKQGMKVNIVQSERDLVASSPRFVLLLKLDKIELGGKRPFGRTARVKVAYTVQNKDRFDLVKRTHEETSASKWQNCVKKISEQLVVDVHNDVVRNSASQDTGGKRDAAKQTPSSPEARLRQLENLRAKGLISQEEYSAKREEMLNRL